MKFALIAAIVVSAVMAYFAVENSQQTQVSFLGWYFDAPLVIILLLSFGAGDQRPPAGKAPRKRVWRINSSPARLCAPDPLCT
ncbi:MAG: hypothetical protein CVU69_07770 [Deltaproteobacteria bacterium HGW-Deltaproteobacteria-4]|nr:MAG: hypothetical protein CVU69_07770 [Deltaproteobacteria bacterium HGW-Deltaproteobacteria-4]